MEISKRGLARRDMLGRCCSVRCSDTAIKFSIDVVHMRDFMSSSFRRGLKYTHRIASEILNFEGSGDPNHILKVLGKSVPLNPLCRRCDVGLYNPMNSAVLYEELIVIHIRSAWGRLMNDL